MQSGKQAPAPEDEKGLQSYIGSLFSTAYNSAYTYMTTPSAPPEIPAKPAKTRRKSKYEDNMTASIALPERPKLKQKACKLTSSNGAAAAAAQSTAGYVVSSVVSLFQKKPALPPADANEVVAAPKPRKPNKEDIDIKMTELVARFNALGEQLEKLPDPKDPAAVANIHQDQEHLLMEQINLVEYEIVEHAQRRVDLYFYLCAAVYQQFAGIEKKSTNKQHGSGTNAHGTNGCHDSLFPHVKFRFPKTTSNMLWSIVSTPPSIRGTHFEDANNMTSELPKPVNDFDCYMELATPGKQSGPSKFVNKLIADLQSVSQGKITPIDAMNRFLKVIADDFFNEFEEKHLNGDTFEFPNVMRRIWELQRVGTVRARSDDSYAVDHLYLCSLLRVRPEHVQGTIQDPTQLLKYYLPIIQKEIFATPSAMAPRPAKAVK